MITTRSIEGVISLIIVVIAYAVSGTLAGYSQAWVAKQFGDDTPEESGLLTLNPVAHIDFVGMFFLLIIGLGWTRNVPLDPVHFSSRLKLIIASCTHIVVYLLISFCSLLILELTFSTTIIPIAIRAVFSNNIFSSGLSISELSAAFPTYSSLALLSGFVLVAMMYLCILLAVLDFIITVIHLGVRFYAPELLYNGLYMFLLSFACIVMLGGILRWYIVKLILVSATGIARLFGI